MIKKIILGLVAVVVVAGGVAGMSAYEAHIINVTAKIENALSVETRAIDFGTVFPQEYFEEYITISLSDSFIDEDRVDDVNYVIKQKPKPRPDVEFPHGMSGHEYCLTSWGNAWDNFEYCAFEDNDFDGFLDAWEECKWVLYEDPHEGYNRDLCYPMLCPFLSKLPDETPEPGNDEGASSPHWPGTGTAFGRLAQSEQDIEDTWTIDLVVPCFQGMCDQDYNWWEYGPPLVPELEGETFGCDLWIEVTGISEPSYECHKWDCLTDLDKDFFTTGRHDPTNWDLAIWEVNGGPETVVDQGEFAWVSGQAESFTVDYDADTGMITYTVDNTTLSYDYGNCYAFDYIIPFAKGNVNGNNTALTNMTLNGNPIPDLYSNNDYWGLKIPLSDANQANGFTLTGDVTLTWSGSHPQEIPAFHVFAMDTHNLPDCPQ